MADKKQQGGKGGGARKIGKNKQSKKYKAAFPTRQKGKKIIGSHKKRGVTPLTQHIQFRKAVDDAYKTARGGSTVLVLGGKILVIRPE